MAQIINIEILGGAAVWIWLQSSTYEEYQATRSDARDLIWCVGIKKDPKYRFHNA